MRSLCKDATNAMAACAVKPLALSAAAAGVWVRAGTTSGGYRTILSCPKTPTIACTTILKGKSYCSAQLGSSSTGFNAALGTVD
jgi:hypothetical protein